MPPIPPKPTPPRKPSAKDHMREVEADLIEARANAKRLSSDLPNRLAAIQRERDEKIAAAHREAEKANADAEEAEEEYRKCIHGHLEDVVE